MAANSERVLVISVDGLAPRAITRDRMPHLCALGRAGGACFTGRTVIPSITVPAHASMFRGVDPARHGLVDNTPLAPATDAASFLAAARAAGRTTASVLCWMPLDHLLEPDAVEQRQSWAAGYDPLDDVAVVDRVRQLFAGTPPDVTLAYLVTTDLAGHAHGWDSPEYLAAAEHIDLRLGELFEIAGDDTSIVVTTDHGGVGHHHGDPLPGTLETFVAIRSHGLEPGSWWPAVSILDVAPTVADLAGAEPDWRWEGASLLGRQRPFADHLIELVKSMAQHSYGERVDMLQHSLQTAAMAAESGAHRELVTAAVLHDIGHMLGEAGEWGLPDHAETAARYLQQWLPASVVEPIRLHVAAKRYLVATDPTYADQLSPASVVTLGQQGGPMSAAEVDEFEKQPYAEQAIALRRCDDSGKRADDPDLGPVGVEAHRAAIAAMLV